MITTEYCPLCGAKWRGGAQKPGRKLQPNSRVFYDCGAQLSYTASNSYGGAVRILITNCLGDRIDDDEEFICGKCGDALPMRCLYCSRCSEEAWNKS